MTDIHRADSARVQPPGAAHDLDELSTVQLVERLTDQLTGLVRTEMTHALTEVKDKGTRFGIGAGVSGVGVLLLLYGFGPSSPPPFWDWRRHSIRGWPR